MIRKRYTVGVPFLLLAALLLPLAVVLAPIVVVCCLILRVDPVETYCALWRLISALRGTCVEIAEDDRLVLIQIS